MGAIKALWVALWRLALAIGFLGIGGLGLALITMAILSPTSLFWRVMTIGMGAIAVLVPIGVGLTVSHSGPRSEG